jgi:hypothetical protein
MSILSFRSALIGIIATVVMDVGSITAAKLRLIAPLPPHLIGRWFVSVARGQAFHTDIGQVPPIHHEMAVAVPVHYAIGIALALLFLLTCSILGLAAGTPIPALGFALCTNLLPWLLMFPAMGYGWFGAHGPTGTRLFFSSFVTHCFYGVGLWLGATAMSTSATHF